MNPADASSIEIARLETLYKTAPSPWARAVVFAALGFASTAPSSERTAALKDARITLDLLRADSEMYSRRAEARTYQAAAVAVDALYLFASHA